MSLSKFPVHDYVVFSFIREIVPQHWIDDINLTRKYQNKGSNLPNDELRVIGRDGTGVSYELFTDSELSYQILSDVGTSTAGIVLITGNVGGVTNLPVGSH